MYEHERKLHDLARLVERISGSDGDRVTAIPGVSLHRYSRPMGRTYCLYEPAVVIAVQGAKRALLGNERYLFDPTRCLITSVEVPVMSELVRATPDEPFLGIVLRLDPRRIAELIAGMGTVDLQAPPRARGLATTPLSAELVDATLRLVRLLETPQDIPIIAPLIEREILYRLVTGEHGTHLRHVAAAGSRSHQVVKAVAWVKERFAHPLRIPELARAVGMSESTLHHHFKAITSMSPLQYQKQLRLQEARRLMLADGLDAASAGERVGYESPTQFSREYRRLYGAPPLRDVSRLRQSA
jgi:AraC-like DNA-binding protein